MKKIAFGLLVFMISFGIYSCDPWEDHSYHENTPSDEEEVIIPGIWKLTELNLEEAYDFNGDGTSSTSLMAETNCYQNELMTFLPDLSGIVTSNSYAEVTIEGDIFTVECIEEMEETPFTWAQTGNTVTITVDDINLTATQTGDTLTYIVPEGFYSSDGEEGGVEILQDLTFIYTKQ